MHKKRSLLAIAIAATVAGLVAAPSAIAADTVTVTSYDHNRTVTYSCPNTCMVISNGRDKWVEDSRGGEVTVLWSATYQEDQTGPQG